MARLNLQKRCQPNKVPIIFGINRRMQIACMVGAFLVYILLVLLSKLCAA